MPQQGQHIVQRYGEDLRRLRSFMEEMGGLVEHQLSLILTAFTETDAQAISQVIHHDKAIDALEHEVETQAIRLLALHGPMAADLREIVANIPMAGTLERIGDYARSIARRLEQMEQPIPPHDRLALSEIGRMVLEHLRRVMDALEHQDATAAHSVWQADHRVDEYCATMTHNYLERMTQQPRALRFYISLLFIIRNLERIGDHITDIAERIIFIATGTLPPPTARPHGHAAQSIATEQEASTP
ncbi:phosphate signaling complex protein PhoU [Bombella sp. ESL0378]|uniref:phosphate signaling complex protein PhoU n=1 Tax=Bombella sp. ESL0378 TaxID=2676442 RepID=UPI0012D8D367|nr:phosphate signaling complex protein PhoU [Bombella sp. ESL0378]MUG04103.1 phosphate signaling complex protein PhoU [Bombella sp. ESL0378]